MEKFMIKGKVLIVDDEVINRKLLSLLAKNIGGESTTAITASNGQKAVEAFIKDDFELVIMDLMMPEMDGIEATRKIREFEKESNRAATTILAVTGCDGKKYWEKCEEAGMNDIVHKPVTLDIFKSTILKHINS